MAETAPAVAFVTLGCKVNRAESETALAELAVAGWRAAPSAAGADVIVVNTCTVTAEADAKTRKAIRRLLRETAAPVVVTGCAAALDDGTLAGLGSRVRLAPDKERLVAAVRAAAAAPARVAPGAEGGAAAGASRTRVALKVQDGCDARCAYCIVPDARGVPRSVPASEAVERARALVEAGTREIVLTGVNLGRYAHGGLDLAGLVRAVADLGVSRIRLSSIEPGHLTPALLETLAAEPAFCAHLHVPLQAGADRVLAAMRRGYSAEGYAATVGRAREALPGLALTTDVIAGFPGETDAEAAETLAFVEACGFAKLHVFRYSERPGTPAAAMPGAVAPAVRDARAAALRDAGERLRAAYAASRAGEVAEALVERVSGAFAEGTTRDYLKVRFPAGGARPGDLAELALDTAAEVR